MTLDAAFLHDIIEHPESDAPRLIYADWLEDRGGAEDVARADFIRVQCALARLPANDPARRDLEGRERALLAAHHTTWEGPLQEIGGPWQLGFERGFVTSLGSGTDLFLRHAPALFALAPIQRVRLQQFLDHDDATLAAALSLPQMSRVTALGLSLDSSGHQSRLTTLACARCLPRLRELELSSGGFLRDEGAQVLASLPLSDLRVLKLALNGIGSAGAIALAESAHLGRLARLELDNNHIYPEGVCALASSPRLANLTQLTLSGNPIGGRGAAALAACPRLMEGLTELRLDQAEIGDEGAHDLACAPIMQALTTLSLRINKLSDKGVKALAESRHLANLAFLDLTKNSIRDPGAIALARALLRNLTTLHLRHNQVRVGGARALATSPHLRRLTLLTLGCNRISKEGEQALRQRFGKAFRL